MEIPERRHARVFFGRADEIRRGYDWVTGEEGRVLLLYGLSGVGKSSFLAAGLLPRLEADHEARYVRRDSALGLLGTLAAAFECPAEAEALAAAWRSIEEDSGRPLVVVLDQVEEAFTMPLGRPAAELAAFVEALGRLFGPDGGTPRGKLILGFRKEWLAEVRARFESEGTPYSELFLRRLDRNGISEAVRGIASRPDLRRHYDLTVEPILPGIIAEDLLEDAQAALAPTLQILLTKMWRATRTGEEGARVFDRRRYVALRRGGGLLADFLDEQLTELEDRLGGVVTSGLALDVLAFHVTRLGTARKRTRVELANEYSHLSDTLPALLRELEALHLLTVPPTQTEHRESLSSRLAHDTLAPLIRARVETSRRPGQMLRRSLEFALADWGPAREGSLLDERELALVEEGRRGMRALTQDEEELITASWRQVEAVHRLRRRSESLTLAALGRQSHVEGHLVSAAALAYGALARKPTDEAQKLAHEIIATWREWLYVLDVPRAERVEFSPDGRYLATVGGDGHVALWQADSGDKLVAMLGHQGSVLRAVFSHDGDRLMTAGDDGTVRSWSVPSGEALAVMGETFSGPRTVAISRDGERAATVGEDARIVTIWSTRTGEAIQEVRSKDSVFGVALDPEGGMVLTLGLRGMMLAFEIESGRALPIKIQRVPLDWFVEFSPDGKAVVMPHRDGAEVWGERSDVIRAHGGPASDAAFSPDGERLLTVGADGMAHLWEFAEDGVTEVGLMAHPDGLVSASFSADGKTVLTGCKDGAARLWSLDSMESVATFRSGYEVATQAVFCRDGTRVATAGAGVALWLTESSRADGEFGAGDRFDSRCRPDPHRLLLRAGDGALHVWSTLEERLVGALGEGPAPITGAHGSADGGRILTWSERAWDVRLWSLAEGEVIRALQGSDAEPAKFGALSADGARAVVVPSHGIAPTRIFDVETGRVLAESRDVGPQPCFDPSGRHLLSWVGSEARILSIDTGDVRVLRGDADVTTAVFSADGARILTVHAREKARVWSVESGQLIREFEQEGGVRAAAFSADGQLVATTPWPRTELARVWSVADGRSIAEMGREKELAMDPSFSPDGTRLLTRSQKMARVWLVSSGECEAVMPCPGGEFSYVAFTPDAERVVTAVQGGEARIWSILDVDGLQDLLRRRIPRGIREEFLPERLTAREKEVLRSGHPGWP